MILYNLILVLTDMMMFNLCVFTTLSIVFEFMNITYQTEFNTTVNKNHIEVQKYDEYI